MGDEADRMQDWEMAQQAIDDFDEMDKEIRFAAQIRLALAKKTAKQTVIPIAAAMVTVHCAHCKDPFMARVADRKRGWGRFCSKRCKAIKQTHG